MTERPDNPDNPAPVEEPTSTAPTPSAAAGGATAAKRPPSSTAATRSTRPRPRPQFESRRVRRVPTAPETPWYNNWRMLVPIVAIIILAVVMLGFALGQASNRAQAPAVQPPAPAIQITADAGGKSIPIEIVTSTPAPQQ